MMSQKRDILTRSLLSRPETKLRISQYHRPQMALKWRPSGPTESR
jgi:hypothetical protein